MKVFIASKKRGTGSSNYIHGVSIYTDKMLHLYSGVLLAPISSNRYLNHIKGLSWGLKRFKSLVENNRIPLDEKIIVFMNSSIVYNWIVSESAPKQYTSDFTDLMLDMALLPGQVEIINSKLALTNTRFKNSDVEELTSVNNLFN